MTDFNEWVPAEETGDASTASARKGWRRAAVPVGLLATGGVVGGVLAATLSANAAPSPTPTPSPYGYRAPGPGHPGPAAPFGAPGRGFHGLDHTGTVTAVGTNSVSIKSGSATTTYVVTANSDIDKNGEATLKDLKVGDAVRFSVVTVSGKATIGILHAGNEALDRPQHGPGGGDHHWGPPPAGGQAPANQSSA